VTALRGLRRSVFPVTAVAYVAFSYWAAHGTLYIQGLVLVAAVFGILAVSLDMVAGIAGLYSLGHAGLFALGAYTTVLLYNDRHWNLFAILPVCVVGVGVVGLALGAVSLRVSGLYFAITTFVFTLVLTVLASDLKLTGGYGGLIGPIFPGFPSWLEWAGVSLMWCCLAGLGVALVLVRGIRRSPLYPVLLGIRDAEPFAAAAGVRTSLLRVTLFGLSAALAGGAGWIFAFQGIVSPGQFSWSVSVNILVMVILGGINTTIGPVLGAVFVTVFPVQVNINPFWQEVLFGALFVGTIIVFPGGFVGLVRLVARSALARLGLAKPLAPAVDAHSAAPVGEAAIEEVARAAVPAPSVNGGAARPATIACRGIVFRYGDGPRVLNDVDFTVREGTIHGLIGPNGSGKSTLVDLISGRLQPESGTISVNGVPVERGGVRLRAERGVARTFQSAVLVRELSVGDNVGIGLYQRVPRLALRAPLWPLLPSGRRDGRVIREGVAGALSLVGATSWRPSRLADAPHGIAQLTQLAAACAAGPRTLILDEPLAGLSPPEVEHAAEILTKLKADGVSIVLIEHQPRFVFALSDDVTVLAAGEVVATGPASAVRNDEQVRVVYLGQ
jgi:ABC-type branched-subunit amino acid transport system ATPase component/ABC-type branched-subunit amino acid transport system permease subunit